LRRAGLSRENGKVGKRFAFTERIWCIRMAGVRIGGNRLRRLKLTMQIEIEQTPILEKTKELCQAILDQPAMQTIRQRINAFMEDGPARAQYDGLVNKGQALQQKQQMSLPLSGEEIADFEQHRDELMKNPVARAFLDAQDELHQVQNSIQQYVTKTLELGRLPTEDDLNGRCGGHGDHGGCGCSH